MEQVRALERPPALARRPNDRPPSLKLSGVRGCDMGGARDDDAAADAVAELKFRRGWDRKRRYDPAAVASPAEGKGVGK